MNKDIIQVNETHQINVVNGTFTATGEDFHQSRTFKTEAGARKFIAAHPYGTSSRTVLENRRQGHSAVRGYRY